MKLLWTSTLRQLSDMQVELPYEVQYDCRSQAKWRSLLPMNVQQPMQVIQGGCDAAALAGGRQRLFWV